MCSGLKLKKKDKSKYWIFNKEVSKKKWENRYRIKKEVKNEKEDKKDI